MQGFGRLGGRFVCALNATCFILLFVAYAIGYSLSKDDFDQLTDISQRLNACVQRLDQISASSDNIVNCEVQLRQIDATLQRLAGNPSPIQPHDEAVKQVENITKEIAGLEETPVDYDAVTQLSETFEGVLAGMPPLAQESMLQNLTSIQWSLSALSILGQTEVESGLSLGSLLSLQDLLDARPIGSPEWLVDRLQVNLNSTKNAWIADLTAGDTIGPDQVADIETALVSLEIGTDARNQLLVLLLNLKSASMQLLQDPLLRQSAAEDLYKSAIAFREALARQPEKSPALIGSVEEVIIKCKDAIEATVLIYQKEEARKTREYQGWVLKQLDEFNRDSFTSALESIRSTFKSFENSETQLQWRLVTEYPAFRSALEKVSGQNLGNGTVLSPELQKAIFGQISGVVGWKSDQELARIVTREAMVKYLLPVEDRYLDPVIGKLFVKVYDEALSQLEGTDDYLYVAKRTVDVEKVLPTDL